ncbi:MAG: aspartate aminotransferase family protein [Alphaproteobacteria bacterium]
MNNPSIPPVLPTYARKKVSFERGEGAYLFTASGEEYLDFAGGVAVNALGHAHPHLVGALTAQAAKVWHVSNIYTIEGQERLARRLVEATFADTVFFTNSGAEANECAIKMARRFHANAGKPERYRLITFEGAFHGRTLATIAAGGQAKHLDGFGPPVDGFDQVPFGDVEAARAAIGPQTAGIYLEPIQGEGGIRQLSPAKLRALRQLCDDHGLLLVLDEVQSGMGRTGRLFAHEWAGIVPDIMAVAKAIGGGFPLGACLATARAASGMGVGTHGSTYGGNPLAMAVGNAVLDVMLADGFIDHVENIAIRFRQKLARLADENPTVIGDIRGQGLMLGLECRVANTTLAAAMMDQKMLSVAAGDNVVRLLPPLIVGSKEIDDAIERIGNACATIKVQDQETS